jgi:uncharacterized protein YbjT (DUF2867 family)
MASREGEAGRPPVALVTGATGITGRHCVEALLRRNEWRVVTLSRRPLDLQLGGEGERVQQARLAGLEGGAHGISACHCQHQQGQPPCKPSCPGCV